MSAHRPPFRISIWLVCISAAASSEMSRSPSYSPPPSWSRTHLAICMALELIDPAGPALSMLR